MHDPCMQSVSGTVLQKRGAGIRFVFGFCFFYIKKVHVASVPGLGLDGVSKGSGTFVVCNPNGQG